MKQVVLALCAVFAVAVIGCGDNISPDTENCATPGDEDGNGQADCDDQACAASCRPVCGNAKVEAGETCDDGNTVQGDGCDNNCTATGCGNAVLTANEGCDDGNAVDGDGCDSNCMVTGCGNGVVTGTEGCDDGNTVQGDGCDNNCTATACGNGAQSPSTGETCDDGNVVDADGCDSNCTTTACGNGVLTASTGEVCDDGNAVEGDGCDSNCTVTACGNGIATMGEACDDGNAINGDGCDANCTITACGNGIPTMGEACDDGNATNGDGCDNNCTVTSCGNGIPTTGEACDDGNGTNGDGCDVNCTISACGNGVVAPGEQCDDSNLVDGDGCDSNCTLTACGNGIPTTGEACDDGNATSGDGCDNNCTLTACGNGVPTPSTGETCDDGNATNGDGCDNNCTVTACGNGVLTSGEECDDGNAVPTDGCTNACTVCGNGTQSGAETCDDGNLTSGDGCDANCTTTACGNGVVTAGEACDDGNGSALDGCDPVCVIEPLEIEPNEDGSISTGGGATTGNDFGTANPDANGAYAAPISIVGAITPAGDEDVFLFENPTAASVTARFDVWNPALGINVPCGTSIDTVIQVRDAAGTSITFNDDRNGIADRCSRVSVGIDAGASVYVQVFDFGDNGAIAGYGLVASYAPAACGDAAVNAGEECDDGNTNNADGCTNACTVCGNGTQSGTEACDDGNTTNGDGCDANCTVTACGNGVQTAGEECEDGNTADGDGCSSACLVEGAVTEIEPNDTFTDAAASAFQITGDVLVRGAIGAVADRDTFQVTVATATVVKFEAVTSAFPFNCSSTIDLRLSDALGMPIITDLVGLGISTCGSITVFLEAGTYFISAEERGNNATLASYFLEVQYQEDRGAESEPSATTGVNDTTATADTNLLAGSSNVFVFGDHLAVDDADVYAITVPAGARIRAEAVEGDRTAETCESNGVDTRLTLFDQNGNQLVEDDDEGRGFCSIIDGTGLAPIDPLARNATATPQTYYIMVRRSTFAAGGEQTFLYRLQVQLR